jgi:D-alanyl-D-alanine endopeptidase (penicillin-binding protein 7)
MSILHRAKAFFPRPVGALMLAAALALLMPVADAAQRDKKTKSAQTQKAKVVAKRVDSKKPKQVASKKASRKTAVATTRTNKQALKQAGRKKTKIVASNGRHKATITQAAGFRGQSGSVMRSSFGEKLGLRHRDDPLELSASVALVMDQETQEILFSKNESAVLPIASITKLMTGLIVADANLPLFESITITQDDVDTYKGSSSRLAVGTTLTREELMHLALMSSENRAAHALGRAYPGGLSAFVQQMNLKARALGMSETRFVEPTGLSSANQSSARDLATLVAAAYERPILRDLSTSPNHHLDVGRRVLRFNNSNRLVHSPDWEIGLQKTGYISEAGRCLVMQARIAGRKMIMVLLDSPGKVSRADDVERMRKWVEATTLMQWPERPRS